MFKCCKCIFLKKKFTQHHTNFFKKNNNRQFSRIKTLKDEKKKTMHKKSKNKIKFDKRRNKN